MTSGQDMYAKKAGKLFDEGLKERADVFGLMGKVKYKMQVLISYSRTQLDVMLVLYSY